MPPIRGDLRERRQNEPPFEHPRVRKDGGGAISNRSSQVEDVDVDFPRSVGECRRPAAPPLDVLDRVEQLLGRSLPANLHGGVPEAPLVAESDGVGAIEGGDAPNPCQPGELGDRPLDLEAAVADVGAETEVRDPPGGVSTLLPPPAPARLPRRLRTRRRRHRRPLPRPAAPLPRTRWCSPRGSAP